MTVSFGSKGGSKSTKLSGWRGFLANLTDDASEAATGLIPGLWNLGSAAASDALRAATGGAYGSSFKLDDIGSAIAHSYADPGTFWGEAFRAQGDLVRGNFSDAWKHAKRTGSAFYDAPLGPVLDAAALFTGGASAYGKAAGLIAKGTEAGSASRLAWAARAGLDPATLQRATRTIEGDIGSFSRPVSHSPLRRAQINGFERVSTAFPDAPAIGVNRRVGRDMKRVERVKDARVRAKTIEPVRQALRGLDREERRLAMLKAQGHSPESLLKFRLARREQLDAEIRAKTDAGVDRWPDERKPDLEMTDSGKLARPDTAEDMIDNEEGVDALLTADRRDRLKANRANLAATDKSIGELQKLMAKQVDPKKAARIEKAAEALAKSSIRTNVEMTALGKVTPDIVANRATLESRVMQLVGAVDAPYAGAIRSHVAMKADNMADGTARSTKFSKPGELAHFKRNTGYNFWNARDVMDPTMVIHAMQQTMEYSARLRRFSSVLGMARRVTDTEAAVLERSGKWKAIRPGSATQRQMDLMTRVLVDAEDVFSGLPTYDETLATLRELQVTQSAGRQAMEGAGQSNALADGISQQARRAAVESARAGDVPGLARRRKDGGSKAERGIAAIEEHGIDSPQAAELLSKQTLANFRRKVREHEADIKQSGEGALSPVRDARDAVTPTPMSDRTAIDPSSTTVEYNAHAAGMDTNARVAVIPKSMYDELVGEFNQTHKFIRMWIDRPTRIWRALTLNFRPAWIVNNYVGQMLLLAVAYGPRGLKEYVTQFSLPGKAKASMMKELAPELSDFGWAHDNHLATRDLQGNKFTRGFRKASELMGDLNQRLTDDHTREAAFRAEMRPHIRRYQKENPGASEMDAARALWENEAFADEVTRRVLDNMVDFADLSNFERSIIKRAIPFYAWMRGISKRTGQLAIEEPWKLAAGAQLGQYGVQANEDRLGKLPPFLEGIVDIGIPGGNVLVTQGTNPFMTPADVMGMGTGAFLPGRNSGPQNPLATLNPLFKAPLEALANQDFFYGRAITGQYDDPSSFAGRLWKQGVNSFAQTRLVNEYRQAQDAKDGKMEYDPLFEPSLKNAILSYLGVPVRDLDVNRANERASTI